MTEGDDFSRADKSGGPLGFLNLLVCPVTGGQLIYDPQEQELISHTARLAYPIRQGVPIMLVDEARSLRDEE